MRFAVIGAGAVGCYFGARLVQAGANVTFLARSAQADLLQRHGLMMESGGKREMVRLRVTAELSGIESADVVLLCVKSYHTADAAKQVAPHLPPETVVLSMQNGVNNADVFRDSSEHPALPAVVYVGAQMDSPTHLNHKGGGHIILGTPRGYEQAGAPSVAEIAGELGRGFPCKLSEFIERDLWQKLIINCAYNAVSAMTQQQYGVMIQDAETMVLMEQIVRECIEVARALGIEFELEKLKASAMDVGRLMGGQRSSTAQDLQRGKRTEIDALNGYITRLAREKGVSAIANQAVYALVKLMEAR